MTRRPLGRTLTGDVTRLSGRGSADLNLVSHAPHIDKLRSPDQARVRITATIPSSSKKFSIERTVANPKRVKIIPNDSEFLSIVTEVASHPEFALSRREITKYIIAPAGDRAKEVQALLRLDEIEQVRTALTRIANDARREFSEADANRKASRAHFLQALSLSEFDPDAVLKAINQRRAILNIEPIERLTQATSFRDSKLIDDTGIAAPKLMRANALAELALVRAELDKKEDEGARALRVEMLQQIKELNEDASMLRMVREQQLVAAGLQLVNDDACPLCDTPWVEEDLRG